MTVTLGRLSIRQSAFISHMADDRSPGRAGLGTVIRKTTSLSTGLGTDCDSLCVQGRESYG